MAQIVLTDKPSAPASQAIPALRSAGVALAATALIALSAHVSIPLFFTPVPLTLQPFAVLLVGLLLSPGAAFAALTLYLLEGAAGLPVFTPSGPGGVLQILGPTGGYLMSYPLAAPLISWIARQGMMRRGITSQEITRQGTKRQGQPGFSRAVAAGSVGLAVILALGAIRLATLTHAATGTLMTLAVFPFLPGGALNIIAAAAIATGIHKLRARKDHAASTL